MRTTRIARAVAVVTAAALMASVTAAAVAGTASAATPKCGGKTATIVGTSKGEVIVGTAGADVIVARGGHDKIYGRGGNDVICAGLGNDLVFGGPGIDRIFGQPGRDKLYGGPGPDFLAGQLDNDTLVGGIGVDKCFQGPGTGPWITCELPVPEPPTLVIAYSDVNTNHGYDEGDVMISKIVDTNGDGIVSPGDTIKMGQYPVSPNVIKVAQLRSQFEDWRVKAHGVTSGDLDPDPDIVQVTGGAGQDFWWYRMSTAQPWDSYEEVASGLYGSDIADYATAWMHEYVFTDYRSPSQPLSDLEQHGLDGRGDDGFIDVDFAPGV